MTEQWGTRTEALTVRCPFCNAPEGEPCVGTRGKLRASAHAERHLAWITAKRQTEIRRHPAELSNWEAPAPYHEPAPAEPGMLTVPIDPDARERGLRHLRTIRRQPTPEPEPPW